MDTSSCTFGSHHVKFCCTLGEGLHVNVIGVEETHIGSSINTGVADSTMVAVEVQENLGLRRGDGVGAGDVDVGREIVHPRRSRITRG